MFNKGDVYTIDGEAVRWVGVVITQSPETGNVYAIEMSYNKQTGEFLSVVAHAYFHVDRPGQRVLLRVATKEEVNHDQ